MRFIRDKITSYREWAQQTRWFHRPLYYTSNALIIVIGFGFLVYLPTEVLSVVLRKGGSTLPDGKDVLNLTWRMKAVMAVSLIFVMVGSGGLAGFMRSLYRGGMYDNWWSLLGSFAAFASLFLYIGYMTREITNALAVVTGDTSLIVTYMTAWLLLLGYAAKVPWDEFRDRCASHQESNWELRHYWDVEQAKKAKLTAATSNQTSDAQAPQQQ